MAGAAGLAAVLCRRLVPPRRPRAQAGRRARRQMAAVAGRARRPSAPSWRGRARRSASRRTISSACRRRCPARSTRPACCSTSTALAKQNKLTFWALTPAQPVPTTDMLQQPYDVMLEGRFGNVSKFLGDVRKLVRRAGRAASTSAGACTRSTRSRSEQPDGGEKFPIVRATVTLNAFRFTPRRRSAGADGDPRQRRPRPGRSQQERPPDGQEERHRRAEAAQAEDHPRRSRRGPSRLACCQGPKLWAARPASGPAARRRSTSAGTTVARHRAALDHGGLDDPDDAFRPVCRAQCSSVSPVGGGALASRARASCVRSRCSRRRTRSSRRSRRSPTAGRRPLRRPPAAPTGTAVRLEG